jgi:hypothetical protein
MLVGEGVVVASEMAAQFKLRLRTELAKAPASDRQFWGPAELLSWCVAVLANDPSMFLITAPAMRGKLSRLL